jgi:hypothetical protein
MNCRVTFAAVCSRISLAILGFVASTVTVTSASASPIPLPAGPIFAEFGTREQYSASNDLNNLNNPARAGVEGNWGIVQINRLSVGTVLAPSGSDIGGPGAQIFSDGQNSGQQILGIFYGVQNNPGGPPFTSTGGILDLYFWSSNNQSVSTPFSASDLSKRGQGGSESGNAAGSYLGFTCAPNTPGCTFLARFDFTPGADTTGTNNVNTIFTANASSISNAYLSVDTGTVGAWTGMLNSDFFALDPNNQPCGPTIACSSPNDVRLGASLSRAGAGPWDVDGTDIIGLGKSGTLRAVAIPEPDSLILVSIGLVMVMVVGLWRSDLMMSTRYAFVKRWRSRLRVRTAAPYN